MFFLPRTPWLAWIGPFAAAATIFLNAPAEARRLSIRELAAREVPLAAIAHRIAAANADACPNRESMSGLILHDLTRYERPVRGAIARAFSMTTGFGVLRVVPGSAGADAGLRVDDEILAIGPSNIEDPQAHRQPRSYRRMDAFHATMQAELNKGPTALLVRRAGGLLTIPLRLREGCGGKLSLANSSTLNAYSDGKHVIVTTGMTGISRGPDELAFVIAHEMAHNILGHSGAGATKGIFGRSGAVRDEIDADRYAVQLMTKAGYKPEGGISFLRNAARRLWWNVSLDHPGFGSRIENIKAAMRSTGEP